MLLNIEKAAIVTSKSLQSAVQPTVKSKLSASATTATAVSAGAGAANAVAVTTGGDMEKISTGTTAEVMLNDVRVVDEVIH